MSPPISDLLTQQRARAKRTAWLLALVAIGFYVAFVWSRF